MSLPRAFATVNVKARIFEGIRGFSFQFASLNRWNLALDIERYIITKILREIVLLYLIQLEYSSKLL